MAEPRIKTTIEFAPEDYERLCDYAESHDVGLGRAIGLLIDGVKPGQRFKPPSIQEIGSHCKEKGYTFDPEAFHAFYESKGWRIGREPMRKWQAACVTWQKREAPAKRPYPTREQIKEFNSIMMGSNAQKYLEAFRRDFGCDPKEI